MNKKYVSCISLIICLLFPINSFAYIDPATGNAFFTLVIAIVSSVLFGIQYLWDNTFIFKGVFQRKNKNIPLLLYSEGNQYWSCFEPILNELERRKIKTEYYTSDADDLCFSQNYQYIRPTFIGKGNKAYAKMAFVRADMVLMTTPGLDVYQLKRSKYVKKYIHFYHAFSDNCSYRLFGTDYYDVLLIDNEINSGYIRELEQKRHLPAKKLVVVGNILLDELQKRIKSLKVKKHKKKTILLSPSWGRESILYQCGEEIINNLLDTEYNLIIRPHPQMKIDNPKLLQYLQDKYPDTEKLVWDFERDNLPSMAQSDLMISDFSSIIFEYAFTFNKPVITMNKQINLSQYDASDLSEKTWKYLIYNDLGKSITKDEVKSIKNIISQVCSVNNICSIGKQYYMHQGKCVENIVDYLEQNIGRIDLDE